MSTFKRLGTIPLSEMMPLLQSKAPDLFEETKSHLHFDGKTWRGNPRTPLPRQLAQRIDDFLIAQEPPYKDPFHEDTEALRLSENKRIREERDAAAMLEYYIGQGLLDNKHNADAIMSFIQTSDKLKTLKGHFTKQTVYIAVDFLGPKGSNTLQWRPKVEVQPPAATPKPWKPGDPLPDNATVAQLHAASVEEVKEWKRRKQGKDGR